MVLPLHRYRGEQRKKEHVEISLERGQSAEASSLPHVALVMPLTQTSGYGKIPCL